MLNNLSQLKTVDVTLPKDERGFLGRECPVEECEGYFTIKPGTGLSGSDLPCCCPYCGHRGQPDTFYTKEQIAYAQSVVLKQVSQAFQQDLETFTKQLEYRAPSNNLLGLNISTTYKSGPLPPIRHYREKTLETDVVCENCTLNYTIYGVFGFCPDCGMHNSRQILEKNLELVEKQVALAGTVEGDLAAHLIGDALENAVSAFDGFGRETCRLHADTATTPAKATNVSFQNLTGARQKVQDLFNIDIAQAMTPNNWDLISRNFQKRHLLAHKMGVVDQSYINATQDSSAVIGRKVAIGASDVQQLASQLSLLGIYLFSQFSGQPLPPVIVNQDAQAPAAPPPDLAPATIKIPGLKSSDQSVFKAVYDSFIELGGFGSIVNAASLNVPDLDEEGLVESLDHLIRSGLITPPRSLRGLQIAHLMPTTYGFETYGSAFAKDFKESVKRVLSHILDAKRGSQTEIVEATGCPPWIVDYVLHDISERDLAVIGFFIGGDNTIGMVKPGLRRYVEEFN